jgi:endonuclease/exonuclease/phosphatase family metal-dependent hydrolase
MRIVILIAILMGALSGSLRADERPEKVTIATWNLEWFFDNYLGDNSAEIAKQESAPSREEWNWKLTEVARVVAEMQPTILCLQEVESRRIAATLAKRLREDHKLNYKVAFIEGEDFFTEQDVAVLSLSGLVEFSRREQTQEMRKTKDFYQIQKQLFCRFEWGTGADKEALLLLNLHLRAMDKGQTIRQRQARLARHYLNDAICRGENVVVIGDLNSDESFEETTRTNDIGILRGLDTTDANDDLTDLHHYLAPDRRNTHLIGKQFDRILVSRSLIPEKSVFGRLKFKEVRLYREAVIRGKEQDKDHMNVFWTIPQEERDVSDHYPLLAEFAWGK